MLPAAPFIAGRRLAAVCALLALVACAADQPPPPPVVEAPPPVIEAAPPPPPPPPSPPNVFAGHVASYKTLAEAEAAWPRLSERFPVLKDAPKRYVEVDLGGDRGKVVRLLLGAFPDRAATMTYCRSLRGAGAYCAPHDLPVPEPVAAAMPQPQPQPQSQPPAAPAAATPAAASPAAAPPPAAPVPARGLPASVLKQG